MTSSFLIMKSVVPFFTFYQQGGSKKALNHKDPGLNSNKKLSRLIYSYHLLASSESFYLDFIEV